MRKILTLCTGLLLAATATHAQWSNIAPDGADYTKIKFTSANTGYVLRSTGTTRTISKTTNAGSSWAPVPFVSGMMLYDFSFVDDNTGFAVADTVSSGFPYSIGLFKTTNGGSTWTPVHTFTGASSPQAKIHFRDALHGVVTETYGKIWSTADGGATWASTDILYAYPQEIDFPSANVGYITCADGTFSYYGLVYKTTDGGATWNEVFDFGDIPLNYSTCGAVQFLDDNTGYMETMNNFYKTTDGGVTWDSLPFAHNNDYYFLDIHFYTPMNGFACDGMGAIYRTFDGGDTWTTDRPADTVTMLYSLDFSNGFMYAAGSGGKILKRTGILGLHENTPGKKFNVYPNPSTGLFYIDKKDASAVDIKVYDATGKVCLGIDAFNGNTIDLSALENGTYMLECKAEEWLQTQKVSLFK